MAEKRFDTRILLKYDSLENWNSSELILKAGEVAIAAVPVEGAAASPVVIKVGDGTRKFSELEMISALASDVYSWAKKSETDFTKWLDETAGFATDAELTAVKTALENKDKALEELIEAIEGGGEGSEGGLTAVYARVSTLEKLLTSFLPAEGAEAVVDAVKNAIDAVAGDVEELAGKVETLEGADTALGNRIAANENKLAGIGAEETVKGLIEGISGEVETVASDLDKVEAKLSDVAEDAKVGALIEAAQSAAESYADGKFGAATSAISGLETRVEANEGAIEVLNSGSEVEGSVAHTVAAEVAKVVANAPEDFDTLKEVADWIANDTTGAAAMQTDIAGLKTTVGEHTTTLGGHTSLISALEEKVGVEAAEGVEATGLYADIETLNSGLDALSETVTGMTGESGVITSLTARVAANEGAIETINGKITSIESLVSANTSAIAAEVKRATEAEATLLEQVEAAQGAADKVAEDLAAEIKRATEKETAIEGSITSLDNSLAAVAKSGKVADLIQGEDEIILDCGNATGKTVIAD